MSIREVWKGTKKRSDVIWTQDLVKAYVDNTFLMEYNNPEKLQAHIECMLLEACCANERKEVGDEFFNIAISNCSCQRQLIEMLVSYSVQIIERYFSKYKKYEMDDRKFLSNLLASLYVTMSAFNSEDAMSYEELVCYLINYECSKEDISWSFSYFETVFEYAKDRCYNEEAEEKLPEVVANIWLKNMYRLFEYANIDDMEFLKYAETRLEMTVCWADYFYNQAKNRSKIWTAAGYDAYGNASLVEGCFPELTADAYKASFFKLLENPDKFFVILGNARELYGKKGKSSRCNTSNCLNSSQVKKAFNVVIENGQVSKIEDLTEEECCECGVPEESVVVSEAEETSETGEFAEEERCCECDVHEEPAVTSEAKETPEAEEPTDEECCECEVPDESAVTSEAEETPETYEPAEEECCSCKNTEIYKSIAKNETNSGIEEQPSEGEDCEGYYSEFERRDFNIMFERMITEMYYYNQYQSVEFAISRDEWKKILEVAFKYTNGVILTIAADVAVKAFHAPCDEVEEYIAGMTYEMLANWNVWTRINSDDVSINKHNADLLKQDIYNHEVVPEASFQLVSLLSNPTVFKIVDQENYHIIASYGVY